MLTYRNLWSKLLKGPTLKVAPRGLPCVELLVVRSRYWVGEIVPRPSLNPRLGFMEGLQLVAGTADKLAVQRVAPKVDLDLFGPMSFYGPRVVDQIPNVLAELRKDPESRRAVLIAANNPAIDAVKGTTPCTLAIQFFIRERKLVTVAYLRSSDVAWGIPYDVMQFSILALSVARVLDVTPWTIELVGGSTHIYDNTRHLQPQEKDNPRFFRFEERTPKDWPDLRVWAKDRVEWDFFWSAGVPEGIVWSKMPVGLC